MGQPVTFGVPVQAWTAAKPALWEWKKAIRFWDVAKLVDDYLEPNVPISQAMVLVIFFHESAYSSVLQGGDRPEGPGVGLGQLEVTNPKNDISDFLNKEFGTTGAQAVIANMRSSAERAVEVHCDFFKWLAGRQEIKNGHPASQQSLLNGQVGEKNIEMIKQFNESERELKKAMSSRNRKQIIDALNLCRWYLATPDSKKLKMREVDGMVQFPITLTYFDEYWKFTLPV